MKTLYVLDAVNFLFRSYYAIGPMTNPKGESTGALYGFIRSVFKLIKELSPSHLVAVFDGPDNSKSRKEIYSDYKAHRTGMPDDLVPQLKWAHKFCEMAGIPFLSIPGVEADDVMGSIAAWADASGVKTFLCSSDKDLAQLVTKNVHVLNIHKNNLDLDRNQVKEIYGVYPEQIIDLLAMMGDASDNIPGLPGIGPKTAASLLSEFGTLEAILKNPEKLKGKKQEIFREGRDIAQLSKQLATIQTDIPFPKEEEFFRLKEPNLPKVQEFYQEMRFLTLLKELSPPTEQLSLDLGASEKPSSYTLVNDEEALIKLIQKLSKKKELALDTETTSLSIMDAQLVGVGLSDEEGTGYYIPCNGKIPREKVLSHLKPLLESDTLSFFGHNIKYDLHILKHAGIDVRNLSFDTMVGSYLLAPHKLRHGLDTLCLELFGKVKTPISDLIGKGKKQISMEEVPLDDVAAYCGEDVDYTFRLKNHLEKELKKEHLLDILKDVEIPLLSILFKMEENGIYLDEKKLEPLRKHLTEQIGKLSSSIYHLADETFNLNSPKQLGVILFEKLHIRPAKKTTTGYSTSAAVLESLREEHPVIEKILQYRTLEKLRSTYVDTLPNQIHPKTGRIHCTFNQSVTATGRLSCQDPNLQNIPVRSEEGKKIRTAFTPQDPTSLFLAADYSQIELRLLAHLSEDPTLIQAFNAGEDIHTYTASLVYNVPLQEVTKRMRYSAKAVNFGILYGQSAFGLAKELGIGANEAKEFIATYFDRYTRVQDYLEFCKQSVREKGYSLTLLGRKRPIPEIDSKNAFIRQAAERLAVNTPLQGTAADLIKLAMIEIDQKLKKSAKMILQIHDELIFEVPKNEIEDTAKTVRHLMETVMKFKIPLVVDISIGKNWGEC